MPVVRQHKSYVATDAGICRRPCVSPPATITDQIDLCGRTLTRSSRQGGLMDQLVLGNAPEHTVRRLWSTTEDALLRSAIQKIGPRKWRTIAEHVPGRSHIQCMQRWHKVLEPTLNKGLWKAEEDEQLRAAVRLHGSSSWPAVAAIIPGRNCKQCRERWNNYLDPTLKKGCWEPAEDKALVKGQEMFGSRWSLLAKLLPGRSQIQVRDRCRVLGLSAKQGGTGTATGTATATAAAHTPTKAKEAAVAIDLPSASSHSPTPPISAPSSAPSSARTSPLHLFAEHTAVARRAPPSPPALGSQFAPQPGSSPGAEGARPAARAEGATGGKSVMAQRAFEHVRGAVADSTLGLGGAVDVDASRGLLLLCAASYCLTKLD